MQLNRRIFLRGLGGAVVAAPFLSSVAERAARAQSTTASDPKRLIVMFTHYGCFTKTWFPKSSHGPLTAAALNETASLKSLAPFADKLLMPRGIRAMNEWSFGAELGQINDPHTQVCGTFFSCHPVTPNGVATGGGLPSDEAKFRATPTGRTLDHIAAEQTPAKTPLFMRVGNRSDTPQSGISYSEANTAFPGVGTPQQVYSQLTDMFDSGGGSPNPDTYQAARGKQVFDLVRHDLESLEAQVMSAADKKKLKDWKDLLVDMTNVVRAECNEATAGTLGLTGMQPNTNDLTAGIAETMMNLAVLTAICDANRVIFLKYPGSYTFTGLGINTDAHGLSHRQGDAFMGGAKCVADVNKKLEQVDTWYADQFAFLVGKLNEFNEAGGSILDNSAVIHFQEMSDGNSHNLNNLPIIQAGGCGGYFKTGQIVNVEDGSATLTNGNSDAACATGDANETNPSNVDGTGTPSNVANAPINKYFVDLLNAIGCKADSTGWPAVGGTEPVKHFGKYDDSKLFADGGSAPAQIKSPGGFDSLRAGT